MGSRQGGFSRGCARDARCQCSRRSPAARPVRPRARRTPRRAPRPTPRPAPARAREAGPPTPAPHIGVHWVDSRVKHLTICATAARQD